MSDKQEQPTVDAVASTEPPMKDLYSSFLQALEEVPDFVTDTKGQIGNRKYGYLSLTKMLKEIKPALAKYGLGFYQSDTYSHDINNIPLITVDTYIFSSRSGESLKVGSYPVLMNLDPQQNGKCITYARRYALYSVLGIYPEQDDDAQDVSRMYQNRGNSQPNGFAGRAAAPGDPWEHKAPQPRQNGITKAAADNLMALARDNGVNLMAMASQLKGHEVKRLRELTQEDGKKLTEQIATLPKTAPAKTARAKQPAQPAQQTNGEPTNEQ